MTSYPPPSDLPPGSAVVAYLRDSGGSKQEDSIERQEEELRRWCIQYRLELVMIYADAARTARKDLHRRKDLLSMMQHFRDGGSELGVIIWNYERFARNIKHGRAFIAELEMLGKVLCSLTDNIPEGPEKFLFQDLKLYSAQMTSAKISIDVTSGLRRLVEQYGGIPGTPPRGFRRGPAMEIGTHRDGSPRIVHRWEPDPELAPLVRKAFEMRAIGSSLRDIAKATDLYKSKNSWSTFYENPLYKGVLEYGDLVIENYCEPVVPPEIWEAVQVMTHRRGHAREGMDHQRRVSSPYLLSGLVYCHYCGAPMIGHSIKSWDYYTCSRRQRRHDCIARQLPKDEFENGVVNALLEQALTLENMLAIQARLKAAHQRIKDSSRDEHIELTRQLKQAHREISNLVEAIKTGKHSRALLDALSDAETREAEVKIQLAALEATRQPPPEFEIPALSRIAEALRALLVDGDLADRRMLLRGLISRLIVMRVNERILGVMYYLPPQQIALPQGEGEVSNYAYRRVPPRRSGGVGQVGTDHQEALEIIIPLRARSAHWK